MKEAVVAGAIAVAAFNAVAGLMGAWLWYRGDPVDERGARAFWVMLRVGQGSALAYAIVVGSLAATGHYASEKLFYLYALLPLAVGFVAGALWFAGFFASRKLVSEPAISGKGSDRNG